MKKNTKKIAVLLLVAFVAVGSYFVAGTYAKYTSEISGTGTGTVAKWAWTIGSDTITSAQDVTNGFSFDLFKTMKEADTTTAEANVDTDLIAPGTGGSFSLAITNDSEVDAEYTVTFTETNTEGIPIEYSTDGQTWVTGVSGFNVSSATPINRDATANITIKWRWAFTGAQSTNYTSSQTDATDTALGFAANTSAPTVTVSGTVTVTQVD